MNKGKEWGNRRIEGRNPINNLLDKHNPSKLDKVVKTVCPYYEEEKKNFTSVYLDFHEYAKVGLLSRLQVELEELDVFAEEETGNGRADGSVRGIGLRENDVFLYDEEGEPAERIALIEVKTGDLKPLQAAAYTYMEKIPSIIAEVKNGSCHIVDLETAERLLGFAKDQMDTLKELRKKDKRIPDSYLCESCTNCSCEYQSDGGSSPETKFVIKNRTEQLTANLTHITGEVVEIIESLLEKEGFSTLR